MGNKAARAVTPTEKALQGMLTRQTTLTPSQFGLSSIGHHGLPSNTRAMALCSLQGILAVGTASGNVKLYGSDGLEVMLDAPRSKSQLTVGIIHMKFTAHQRLVVSYTDSSIRIFDLARMGHVHAEVFSTWTTSSITCIETTVYQNYPFVFVALDDGNIHVLHEDTGKMSTYVITPRDVGVTTKEEDKHTQYVTAMASDPRDANHLLIAYEASTTIYLWDFAKRKLSKEFTLAKAHKPVDSEELNTIQSLSWHSSGKRFVAGYKYGGFGVFRIDKPHGLYHTVMQGDELTPIKQIQWLTAPPTSKQSHLPGAVVLLGGRIPSERNLVTVVYPPSTLSEDEAITQFVKSDHLTWQTMTLPSANASEILCFALATDQVEYCAQSSPFSLVLLSGNPLDGCQPGVSVQCLPCFVRLREEDKEDWEWRIDRLPAIATLGPPMLQRSPLKTFTVIELNVTKSSLLDDLRSAAAASTTIDSIQLLLARDGEFAWPLNGGAVVESMRYGDTKSHPELTTTLVVTAHDSGVVLFWELLAPTDPTTSKGLLSLLYSVDVASQMTPIPATTAITSVSFCPDARTLVVGFTAGEVAVLEFCTTSPSSRVETSGDNPSATVTSSTTEPPSETLSVAPTGSAGLYVTYALHIHSSAITRIAFSSSYNYVVLADDAGVVSLIDLTSQNYELIIFDLSSDEPVSVESLVLTELVQITEIPTPTAPPVAAPQSVAASAVAGLRASLIKSPPRRSSTNVPTSPPPLPPGELAVVTHREIIPVLFVGRGNGKLELFHVQTAKKIGEYLVDPTKSSALTSIVMVDASGRPSVIKGRSWQDMAVTEQATTNEEKEQEENEDEDDGEYVPQTQVSEEDKVLVEQILKGLASTPPRWRAMDVLELRVPPGSLGLHLSTEIDQHAVVTGFVPGNETAIELERIGVCDGSVLMAINGVDLRPYGRSVVCSVLEKLRDHEKLLAFASGFHPAPSSPTAVTETPLDKPRLMICACGKSVHLVHATLPQAAEIASGLKELPVQPLASIELGATIVTTSIIRVPIHDRIEHCLVAIDQSNRLYVIALLTLNIIWTVECTSLGNAYDGIQSAISYTAELIIANGFGEMERFSLLGDATARESAALTHKSIKTRVILDERKAPLDKEPHPSPKKKSGIADAGKMFKKLVTGIKEVDLTKIFHFSTEEMERNMLMGDRKSTSASKEPESKTKAASDGLAGTKEALQQASQHLHERGEKLSDLALKTEQMKDTAEDFYKTMKAFNDKNANKKWYEF